MMKMRWQVMVGSALFLLVPFFAVGFAMAAEIGTLYRGVRPLGMGGAFITLSDDGNALFYNPAGLNDIEGFGRVDIIDPLFEVSSNTISLVQDAKDLKGKSETAVTDFLVKHIGEQQHLRVAVFPNLTAHNFGIGVLGQGTADIVVQNPAFPSVEADVKLDVGALLGFAYSFWDERLQMGITGKYIQRSGQKRTLTVADIAAGKTSFTTKEARDWAMDVGAKVKFPMFLSPTFAVVVQNITDLDFSSVSLGKLPQQVNVGVAIHPDFWILKTAFALEVDDVTKQVGTDNDLYKRTHLGAEFRFPKILSVRAGINQGYATAGLTIDFWLLKIGYANYAEEIGAFAGQLVDRRHVLEMNLGF